MGRRRPFIDKKASTTYQLIYRGDDGGAEEPERLLVDASRGVGVGRPDTDAIEHARQKDTAEKALPPGHPLAWLAEGREDLSEGRRRETIELGFPDDGYDYIKHLRASGRRPVSIDEVSGKSAEDAEAHQGGASVFVPAPTAAAPEEDVKTVDARRLAVHQQVTDDDDAAKAYGGVTAFSRELQRVRQACVEDMDEVSMLLRRYEDIEDYAGGEGCGDLLDDFIISATKAGPGEEADKVQVAGLEASEEDSGSEESSSGDSDQDHLDAEQLEGRGQPKSRGRAGSIASTYWRQERHDRNNNLSMIDERRDAYLNSHYLFERLALEYDSDEIGDLEEDEAGTAGAATVQQFGGLLDEFLNVHATPDHAHEGGQRYHAAAEALAHAPAARHDQDAAVAIAKARELLRAEEEREARRASSQPRASPVWEDEASVQPERWDCETILSLTSNLDNHPGMLREPRAPRGALGRAQRTLPAGEQIRLSEKTGLPIGFSGLAGADGRGTEGRSLSVETPSGNSCALGKDVLPRRRGESAEDKRERKQAVKESKRAARATKKEVKAMYKEESLLAHQRMPSKAVSVLPLH